MVVPRRLLGYVVVGMAACAACALEYRPTVSYGFDYDDYHFVRPYALREVQHSFVGTWDPSGIEVPFYRPLTVAFFAARFEILGLNAAAYHRLSIAMFALAATLCGWFILRLFDGRVFPGIAGALLFALHPAMAYSLVCWPTNQMHLIETIVVLSALLWWTFARDRPAAWWTPLMLFAAAAFMIKEDGIMLLPVLIVLQLAYRSIVAPRSPPLNVAVVAATGTLVALLSIVRGFALHGLGGYGRPGIHQGWVNFVKGLVGVFLLVPADRPYQPQASWFAMMLPACGIVAAAARHHREALFCMLAGAALAVGFDLPFVLVSKGEQYHLVATGAVMVIAGATAASADLFRNRIWKAVVLLMFAAGVAAMAVVTRDISRDFDPFGPIVLHHDRIVQEWAVVPEELRQFLRRKTEIAAARRMSSNPIDETTSVAWGLLGREADEHGVPIRWLGGRVGQILVTRHARSIKIPVRHLIEFTRQPVSVRLSADGRLVDEIVLRDRDWHVLQVALGNETLPAIGRMHRLRLDVDRTWSPVDVIPKSTDTRIFGVQVGELEIR